MPHKKRRSVFYCLITLSSKRLFYNQLLDRLTRRRNRCQPQTQCPPRHSRLPTVPLLVSAGFLLRCLPTIARCMPPASRIRHRSNRHIYHSGKTLLSQPTPMFYNDLCYAYFSNFHRNSGKWHRGSLSLLILSSSLVGIDNLGYLIIQTGDCSQLVVVLKAGLYGRSPGLCSYPHWFLASFSFWTTNLLYPW